MRTGRPSVFIRFTGCNLRCWWCDTPYTSWRPEVSREHTIEEVVQFYLDSPAKDVVVTGGEPMLHGEKVHALVDALGAADDGSVITIETNGTIYSHRIMPEIWSVSPKLSDAAPQDRSSPEWKKHTRNNSYDETIGLFIEEHRCSGTELQFKFVISHESLISEVEDFCSKHDVDPELIWLMPNARTKDQLEKHARWLAEACIARGFNYSPRLHTWIWNNERNR